MSSKIEAGVWSRPLRGVLFAGLALGALGGCGGAQGSAQSPNGARRATTPADVDRWMARENGPFAKHTLQGELASAEYEAASPAKAECTKDSDGDQSCLMQLDMGRDSEGTANTIVCQIGTTLRGPFGTVLTGLLDGARLAEVPSFAVQKSENGIAAQFVSNYFHERDKVVGTVKLATFYSRGSSATCWDLAAGGRQTFARVTGAFFASLQFKPSPRKTHFAQAYERRKGDRATGFRYTALADRADKKSGLTEIDLRFTLETDGKSWVVDDGLSFVTRDAGGKIDFYKDAYFRGGTEIAALSVRPAEDGKLRVKLEVGPKSDAIELRPKAPLNSELWAASDFASVAAGKVQGYRYAIPGVKNGEPTLRYISITRASADVVLEEADGEDKEKGEIDAHVKDELHLDTTGRVAKEVASSHVAARVYTWGSVPTKVAR